MNKEERRWQKLIKKLKKRLPPRFLLLSDDFYKGRCRYILRSQFPQGLNRHNKKIFMERVIHSIISDTLGNSYMNQIFLYQYLWNSFVRFSERYGNLPVGFDTDSVFMQHQTPESVMERVEAYNNGVDGIEASEVVVDECGNSPEEIGRFMHEMAQNIIPTPTKITSKIRKCPICGTTLNTYYNFPKWYPEKWRVCCYCHDAYKHHYNINENLSFHGERLHIIEEHYIKYKKELEERFGIQ